MSRPRRGGCHLLVVVALLAAVAGPVSAGGDGLDRVAWFVQVSDLHFSRFATEQLRKFGDKEGDFRELTARVIAPLRPKALIVTGDLVDSKTSESRGQQFEEEWQAYRRVLDDVVATAGLPEPAILDVRGNHDVYDVPARLGEKDFFSRYAAHGRRNGTQRVVLTAIGGGGSDEACPAAILVGIDAAPEPGLRGPTNFHGVLDAATLGLLDGELKGSQSYLRGRGCAPPYIAYGHYPLGVTAFPDTRPWYAPDPVKPPPTQNGSIGKTPRPVTLRSVLQKRRVQAYLCGHLHGLFGPRLHRVHPGSGTAYLAELEAAGWKDDRRFRLLTVDCGTLSFSDLYFNTPTKVKTKSTPLDPILGTLGSEAAGPKQEGYSITSLERSQLVASHIVAITSPPDGRYAPLPLPLKTPPRTYQGVRALVLPLAGAQAVEQVNLLWSCPSSGWNGTYDMERVVDGQPLYEADISTGLECGQPADGGPAVVAVQVVVTEEGGGVSSSEVRRVAIAQRAVGTGLLAEPSAPLPLRPHTSFLGDFVMRSYMPRVAYLLFQYEWAGLLALLVLPRFCPPGLVAWLQCGSVARWALGWPLLALHRTSLIAELWYPQVLYALYLRYGPWFAARFQAGGEAGLYWAGALLLAPTLQSASIGREVWAGWRWFQTADSYLMPTVHMAFTILPLTALLASLVAALDGRPGDPPLTDQQRKLVITLHNVPGACLVWLHSVMWRRLAHLYSIEAVLLSPGFGWTVPLACWLAVRALKRTSKRGFQVEEAHAKKDE